MLKENTKIFITIFTVTSSTGEEKSFPGPFIFAYDYQEACQEEGHRQHVRGIRSYRSLHQHVPHRGYRQTTRRRCLQG